MRPLSRRSGVWIEACPTAIHFGVPVCALALSALAPATSPQYAGVPLVSLSFDDLYPSFLQFLSSSAITLDFAPQNPKISLSAALPNAVLLSLAQTPRYQPIAVSVPTQPISFSPQIVLAQSRVMSPRGSLLCLTLPVTYAVLDNTVLEDTSYFTDTISYSLGSTTSDGVDVTDVLASAQRISQARAETLVAQDTLSAIFSGDFAETAVANEVMGTLRPLTTTDTILTVDSLSSGSQLSAALPDQVVLAADTLAMVSFGPVADGAQVADNLDGQHIYRGVSAERSLAAEGLSAQLALVAGHAETLALIEVLSSMGYGETLEGVSATADLAGWVTQQEVADEPGLAQDSLISALRVSGGVGETILSTEFLTAGFDGGLTDSVTATATLESQAEQVEALLDRGYWHEALAAHLAGSAPTLEVGSASDTVGYAWVAETAETLHASDQVVTPVAVATTLADTVGSTVALGSVLTVYATTFVDTGVATGSLESATALRLVGVLSDTGLAGDALVEAAQLVCVVNAETGAVSTYTLTPTVAGMVSFRGTLYLAGPDGLYAVDADEDDAGAVVWTLQTGFSNLGTDLLKRIRDVNVQGRTEGDTMMQVISDRYGQKQTWNYRLPLLTRSAYRDGVIKPGRGIASVYYALGLRGQGPAELDQLRVVVEPLSRRR